MAFGESTPGTLNIRVQTSTGPQTFDVTDFGPYPLYSTAIISRSQNTEIRLFQYGRGGAVPGGTSVTGTKLDTNMESGNGQLDASSEMLIYSMRVVLPSNINLADAQAIFFQTYCVLYIATQKPTSEGGVEFYPAGGGVTGYTTQNAAETWTNGTPNAASSRVFAQPNYLSGLVSFSAAMEFPYSPSASWLSANWTGTIGGVTGGKIKFVLDGLRKRNVA